MTVDSEACNGTTLYLNFTLRSLAMTSSIKTLFIQDYRSLRDLGVTFGRLSVICGPNGSGKSNLYRTLRLLADIARGNFIESIAQEDGISSAFWAGNNAEAAPTTSTKRFPRASSLRIGFAGSELGYAIDLGLPIPQDGSLFNFDPEIKSEHIWHGPVLGRKNLLVERINRSIKINAPSSMWDHFGASPFPYESIFQFISDPRQVPETLVLRQQMLSWRFYEIFRTDYSSPIRQSQLGVHSPVLASDGSNLAAALQTIREIGSSTTLDDAILEAFPGSRIEIRLADHRIGLYFRQLGINRAFSTRELSDGILRFLCLTAALMTPRPPPLMVLNEPETSLDPNLFPTLARLIVDASISSQIIVTSHSELLISALSSASDCTMIALKKIDGETLVAGRSLLDQPAWRWNT